MSEQSNTAEIDQLVAALDRLEALPVDQHPEAFDEVHTALRDALANAGRAEDHGAQS